MSGLKDFRRPTFEQMATICLEGGLDGHCPDHGNCRSLSPEGAEEHPRWCDGCPAGRAGLHRLYGDLPIITYQPGYLFRWSCANGLLFLHTIIGEPAVKAWCSRTGQLRGIHNWIHIVDLPLDPALLEERLAQADEHERHEWLRIDGVAPFYPHCLHEGEIDRRIEGRNHCAACDEWFNVGDDDKQVWSYPGGRSDLGG